MIVAQIRECGCPDQSIGTRPIFDNDRLLPSLRQPISKETGRKVGPASGSERDDEANTPLRPWIGSRNGRRQEAAHQTRDQGNSAISYGHDALRLSHA
jgi:hypothetical protein